MRVIFALSFLIFFSPDGLYGASGVSIENLRFGDHSSFFRLVLNLSAPARYQVIPHLEDNIVLVRVLDVSAIAAKRVYRAGGDVVHSASIEDAHGVANVRILLRRSDVRVSHFSLSSPDRIVLDFMIAGYTRQKQENRGEPPPSQSGSETGSMPSSAAPSFTEANTADAALPLPDVKGGTTTISQNPPEIREAEKELLPREKEARDEILYKLGSSLFERGEYAQALKKMEELVDNFPESVYAEAAFFIMGDSHFKMGEAVSAEHYKRAVEAYQMAIRTYPDSGKAPRALLNTGKCYENLRTFYEAEAYYKRLVSDYPESEVVGEAYFRLGEVEYKAGDYESAGFYFKKVLSEFPGTGFASRAIYRLGDSLYQQNDLFNALSYYERALGEFPQHVLHFPQSLFYLGDIYFQSEEYEKASRTLLRAVNLFPGWEGIETAMAKIGDSYYHIGDFDRAVGFYSQTVSKYPASEGSMLSKLRIADITLEKLAAEGANIPNREEAYEESLKYYREVADSDFSQELSQLALFKLGIALSDLQRYSPAIEAFKELLRDYPGGMLADKALSSMREALKGLINFRYTHQDFVPMVALFQEYAQTALKHFYDVQLLYQVGDSFQRLGLHQEAAQLFSIVLEQQSDNPYREKVAFQLGRLNLLSGNYADAQRFLNLYIKEYPNSPMARRAYKLLGDVQYHGKNFYRAYNLYLDSLLSGNGEKKEAQTYYFLGSSLRKLGDHSSAVNAYLEVVDNLGERERENETPYYLRTSRFLLAESLFDAGKFAEALEEYKRATDIFPEDERAPWAAYRIGQCYERLGLQEKAMEAYRELEDVEEGSFWAVVAGERIADLSWGARLGSDAR